MKMALLPARIAATNISPREIATLRLLPKVLADAFGNATVPSVKKHVVLKEMHLVLRHGERHS